MNFSSSHYQGFCKNKYSQIYDQTPCKIPVKKFFSKTTGNSPKILLKMNSFTNIFQQFQITDLATL